MRAFKIFPLFLVIFLQCSIFSFSQGTFVDFSRIPKTGTILFYAHLDDDLIWMLPFWEITDKFIGGNEPRTPGYESIIHDQQVYLDNNSYNIEYEPNWFTPWGSLTNYEYGRYYGANDPEFQYLAADHLIAYWDNNDLVLVRNEINRIKAKIEQFIASPATSRIITHNNWGEYGHQHHKALNNAVRELAVKYRKDVWMLGAWEISGDFLDVTVPAGIKYTLGSFNDTLLYKAVRKIYQTYGYWTYAYSQIPSGDHRFIEIVEGGSDRTKILTGESITSPGPYQAEPGAYIFDGIDDYMTLQGNNYSPFTISMRIMPDQIREMDISATSEYPGEGKTDRNIYLNADGRISARIYDGTSRIATSVNRVSAGAWSVITITGDGSSLKLYINGVLETSVRSGSAITNYSTPELVLGKTAMTGSFFKGQVSDVRLFNRALSNSEIAALTGILYTITSSAGPGGTISPAGSRKYSPGSDAKYTITPYPGYDISGLVVDGVPLSARSSYTFTGIRSDHSIKASFSVRTFTITSTAGSGGTISPSGNINVSYGAGRTYTIKPDEGYYISDVRVDGKSVGAVSSYTFSSVTNNHSISASFAQTVYKITSSAMQGGSITPEGDSYITYGKQITYAIKPVQGYKVSDVKVDGNSVGTVGSYTFTNVAANHEITANFSQIVLSVKASCTPGGSITGPGNVNATFGTDVFYSIVPDIGYEIENVYVDSIAIGPVSTYTFSGISQDHSISASFRPITFLIKCSSGTGGCLDPKGDVSLNFGSSQKFVIKADSGYKIVDVRIDSVSIGAASEYTFDNIKANHTISAWFRMMSIYSVKAGAGDGGSITPSGTIRSYEGSDQTYTITPDYGYRILKVMIDGHPVGSPGEYKFIGLSSDHTIEVEFTSETDIVIYPNPFTDEFNVKIINPDTRIYDLKVFDLNGRVVFIRDRVPGNAVTAIQLPLNPGLYFLRVFWRGTSIATLKLIKT